MSLVDTMRRLSLASLLVLLLVLPLIAGEEQSASAGNADVDLTKLRVKELKRMLEERGVECQGCIEKEHLVSHLRETIHLPLLTEEERRQRQQKDAPKKAPSSDSSSGDDFDWSGGKGRFDEVKPGDSSSKDADIQKILEKLKASGSFGDKIKMFSAKDFENIAKNVDHRKGEGYDDDMWKQYDDKLWKDLGKGKKGESKDEL
ncbi:hypothetical protein CLOM_g14503 [Closterium sp. NIES-68]|nr:hypothetical protein CLOM_g14503 [Closterium sp. NIES-68]GJP64022.1 hypothetical protein CLOP_g21056 [Closterium sp. NIES-67]